MMPPPPSHRPAAHRRAALVVTVAVGVLLALALPLAACMPGAGPTRAVATVPPSTTARPEAPAPGTVALTPGPARPLERAPTSRPGQTAASTAPAKSTARPSPALKLTPDGCCPEPQWLPDSSGIIFYGDGNDSAARRATWRVPRGGGAPQLFSIFYGAFSPDRRLVAYPDRGITRIARLDAQPVGALDTHGARVHFAPAGDRVAWLAPAADVARDFPALEPPSRIAVARVDGGDPRVLPPVVRTETLQWFPDGRRILVSGRDAAGDHPGLLAIDVETGALTRLADGQALESPAIAPNGQAIVYTATLEADPARNGVWLVGANGDGPRRLDLTGGYRWTPDSQALLFIPAPSSLPTDELWRYRLADNSRVPLVSAAQAHFTVAADDWELAPDGTAIIYRSATDGAIWLLSLSP